MTVPSRDELLAQIASKSGLSLGAIDNVLTGQGISLVPVAPVNRAINVKRLRFCGTRTNTEWDGPFDRTFDFKSGITAFTTDKNLRGKSSVLELLTWALRGKARDLRSDVRAWFDRVEVEYVVNGVPMAVVLTKGEAGHFIADVVRATDAATLRGYLAGETEAGAVNVVAANLSESQFAKYQDEAMMSLLGLDPITHFQRHQGSDQGAPRANTWPAYYGGIHPPRNSELLFGDTVFAGLPARILQLFCNVPLMGTYIRLNTLVRVQRQDEANTLRRAEADTAARKSEKNRIETALEGLNQKLANLPSTSGRAFSVVADELREAEKGLDAAAAASREAQVNLQAARTARQQETLLANRDRETELAALLFQGLSPAHCPRCEQEFEAQRTHRELDEHECAVCTKALPTVIPVSDDGELEPVESEEAVDALAALQEAEDAAKESAEEGAALTRDAHDRVEALAIELSAASQADEFTARLDIQLEQARLQGQLDSSQAVGDSNETSETIRALEAALEVLREVTTKEAGQLFADLDSEILAIGRRLGIDNLDSVKLNRNGGMEVTTAGVEEAFKQLSGGERVRLRVAVIVALLRIGHRSGVGSHPGLVLLDSPGDELTVDAEATLLRELDSLTGELPTLQVLVASDEPAAVQGHLDDGHVYSSLDGSPLW